MGTSIERSSKKERPIIRHGQTVLSPFVGTRWVAPWFAGMIWCVLVTTSGAVATQNVADSSPDFTNRDLMWAALTDTLILGKNN
jgi:hypothetical protein